MYAGITTTMLLGTHNLPAPSARSSCNGYQYEALSSIGVLVMLFSDLLLWSPVLPQSGLKLAKSHIEGNCSVYDIGFFNHM